MKKVILAFVPVIHSGYIKFFANDIQDFFILGRDFSSEIPYLTREMRMLEPEIVVKSLDFLGKNIKVLSKDNLTDFLSAYDEVIMPDEDISRHFMEKYLSTKKVVMEKVFLRWDKLISQAELKVAPDRVVSTTVIDNEFMNEALKQAERSSDWWRQIGAVIVKGEQVIISGYNKHLPTNFSPYLNGDPRNNFDAGVRIDLCTSIHAEAGVIAQAAKQGISLEGAMVYVTTFPCPTCARLVAEAGIKKVFYSKGYSLLDAESILKGYGVEIVLVKTD